MQEAHAEGLDPRVAKPPGGAGGALLGASSPSGDWLCELGVAVCGGGGAAGGLAFRRVLLLGGARRFVLRVTGAWVDGVGLSAWAYYGAESMEIPKRVYARMLRANFEYAFVKFALTDDDRPMLMTELPPAGLDRDALALLPLFGAALFIWWPQLVKARRTDG